MAIFYTGAEHITLVNSSLYSQGDGIVFGGPREDYACDGAETLLARNDIFLGDTDYSDLTDVSFFFYQEGCLDLKVDSDYNVAYHTKNVECGTDGDYVSSGAHDLCRDPLPMGPLTGQAYGMAPTFGSPAIDSADAECAPAVDILGNRRPIGPTPDIGAFEVGSAFLPITLRPQ